MQPSSSLAHALPTSAGRGGEKYLLVARVALGDPYYASGPMTQARRPPERPAASLSQVGRKQGLTYDSTVANSTAQQAHRELIVYDRRRAYPEYVVRYQEG